MIRGWDIVIVIMEVNEISFIIIKLEYVYGIEGSGIKIFLDVCL